MGKIVIILLLFFQILKKALLSSLINIGMKMKFITMLIISIMFFVK